MKNLFDKYKKPLLTLANNKFGRIYLDISNKIAENKKIDKFYSNAFGVRISRKKARMVFRTSNWYARKLAYPLSCLEVLKDFNKWSKNEVMSLFNYCGLSNYNLPQIMASMAFSSEDGGTGCCRGQSNGETNWDTIHDASSMGIVQVANYLGPTTGRQTDNDAEIDRLSIVWNTNSLQGQAIVAPCLVKVYPTVIDNEVNDGKDYITVVHNNMADKTLLDADDYDQIGNAINNPTKLSNDVDFGNLTINQYNSWTLNATGRGQIDKNSRTALGMREGHDIEDNDAYTAGKFNEFWCDQQISVNEPLLDVTYYIMGGMV